MGTEADQWKEENIRAPSQVHLRKCAHALKWQAELPLLFTGIFLCYCFSFGRAESRRCRDYTWDEDGSAVNKTCRAKFLSTWQSPCWAPHFPSALTHLAPALWFVKLTSAGKRRPTGLRIKPICLSNDLFRAGL